MCVQEERTQHLSALRRSAQNRLPIANYGGLNTGAHLASFSGAIAVTNTVGERSAFLWYSVNQGHGVPSASVLSVPVGDLEHFPAL